MVAGLALYHRVSPPALDNSTLKRSSPGLRRWSLLYKLEFGSLEFTEKLVLVVLASIILVYPYQKMECRERKMGGRDRREGQTLKVVP